MASMEGTSRKIMVVIPAGAKPGETQMKVDPGGSDYLLVTVPVGAVPGDSLVLVEEDSGTWKFDGCESRRVEVLVPPGAEAGVTKLEVDVGEDTQELLHV